MDVEMFCDRCEEDFTLTNKASTERPELCESCEMTASERAWERSLGDLYGSDLPYTLEEEYQAAAKLKREVA